MSTHQATWINKIIHFLESKPEHVKTYCIPTLLFLVDLVLRAGFGVDLIDAGADMALIAATSFSTVLIESLGRARSQPIITFPLFLVFLMPWIVCLWSISNPGSKCYNIFGFRIEEILIRYIISWSLGIISFILSSAFVNHILEDSSIARI